MEQQEGLYRSRGGLRRRAVQYDPVVHSADTWRWVGPRVTAGGARMARQVEGGDDVLECEAPNGHRHKLRFTRNRCALVQQFYGRAQCLRLSIVHERPPAGVGHVVGDRAACYRRRTSDASDVCDLRPSANLCPPLGMTRTCQEHYNALPERGDGRFARSSRGSHRVIYGLVMVLEP